MQGLRWYWLAIAASVHCLLVFPVTLITGSVGSLWIPFALGVYSLWQLTLPEVRNAFWQRAQRNDTQRDESDVAISRPVK